MVYVVNHLNQMRSSHAFSISFVIRRSLATLLIRQYKQRVKATERSHRFSGSLSMELCSLHKC